jgi:hypothetical protein
MAGVGQSQARGPAFIVPRTRLPAPLHFGQSSAGFDIMMVPIQMLFSLSMNKYLPHLEVFKQLLRGFKVYFIA